MPPETNASYVLVEIDLGSDQAGKDKLAGCSKVSLWSVAPVVSRSLPSIVFMERQRSVIHLLQYVNATELKAHFQDLFLH